MEQRRAVNVWFDRPGDFLDISWGNGWSVDSCQFPNTDYWLEVHLTEDSKAVGFHAIGALHFANACEGETVLVADVRQNPVTVKYSPATDQWDVVWGPDIVDCVETSNSRVKAQVDARGDIQGVLISDLRTFEDEILNQDIYAVKPGAATT